MEEICIKKIEKLREELSVSPCKAKKDVQQKYCLELKRNLEEVKQLNKAGKKKEQSDDKYQDIENKKIKEDFLWYPNISRENINASAIKMVSSKL